MLAENKGNIPINNNSKDSDIRSCCNDFNHRTDKRELKDINTATEKNIEVPGIPNLFI